MFLILHYLIVCTTLSISCHFYFLYFCVPTLHEGMPSLYFHFFLFATSTSLSFSLWQSLCFNVTFLFIIFTFTIISHSQFHFHWAPRLLSQLLYHHIHSSFPTSFHTPFYFTSTYLYLLSFFSLCVLPYRHFTWFLLRSLLLPYFV